MHEARLKQISTLMSKSAFTPEWRRGLGADAQIFRHKWVDKNSKGLHKSRLTCADVKASYTKEQNDDLDVHVPTPLEESHVMLEIVALVFDWQ